MPEVTPAHEILVGSATLGVQVTTHVPTALVPVTTIAAVVPVIATEARLSLAAGSDANPAYAVNLAKVSQDVKSAALF